MPNYFISADEVREGMTPRSYVKEYEDAKVIVFPNLRPAVDFDFWASLDTDKYPGLKKLPHSPDLTDLSNMNDAAKKMKARDVPEELVPKLCAEMSRIYQAVIPAYQAIFGEYQFMKSSVVWRLNTIMAENLHLDTPADLSPHHFARMFVNLDTQPRIWQTSWTAADVSEILKGKMPSEALEAPANVLWMKMNLSTFGKNSSEFWDEQPRHVAFFDPGDVWIVDSRQVAHQIFYGRRAVSIDFFVDPAKMLNPTKHYVAIAEKFRAENRQPAHV
ncbi:Kdo hydroxylase family protein [Rhizobium ruizarguesonis]|uniref:Kdo hydroxylase family protein n=1 Tax=Rhizobium ruizarguesonis TaxID=2081791 RepID=UPI0013EEF8A2|nr:Kdo hydroxylase family protein [Rhizobium ruizarguesonis]